MTRQSIAFQAYQCLVLILFTAVAKAEDFANSQQSNQPVSLVGWEAYRGVDATDYSNQLPNTGDRIGIAGVAGPDGDLGYLFSVSDQATWAAMAALPSQKIAHISWKMGNSQPAISVRLLVRQNEVWYASEETFSTAVFSSISDFQSTPEYIQFKLSIDAAQWQLLDFEPESSLALMGQPEQDLANLSFDGIGFFIEHSQSSATCRIDDLVCLEELSVPSPPPTDIVKSIPGLVAFWTFGEASGQARASEVGDFMLRDGGSSPVTRVSDGPFSGYAASFNGSSNYLTLPNADLSALDISGENAEVSVVSWVKWTTTGNAGFVSGIWQEDNNDPRRQYGLFINLPAYGGPRNVCGHVSRYGGPSPKVLTSGYLPYSRDYFANLTEVQNSSWATAAFTYDGEYARSYLNAKFEERPDYTEPNPSLGEGITYAKNPYYFPDGLGSNGGDFTVGAVKLTSGMANWYKGLIGGVAVFNRALSPYELFILHAASVPENEPVIRFSFRNSSGSELAVSTRAWRAFEDAETDASENTSNGWLLSSSTGTGTEGSGYLAKTTTGKQGFAWTDAIPEIPTTLIKKIQFTANSTHAADNVNLALKIDDVWYLNTRPFSMSVDGAISSDWNSAELQSLVIDRDAHEWQVMAFDESGTLETTPVDPHTMPLGLVQGIGFFQEPNAGVIRIDDLEIFISKRSLVSASYSTWKQWQQLQNSDFSNSSSEPETDYDADGLSNLLEYAFARSPSDNEGGSTFSLDIRETGDDHVLNITAHRRKYASISMLLEASPNLSSWESLPGVEPTVLDTWESEDDEIEKILWQFSLSEPYRFFRFSVNESNNSQ